MVEFLQQLDVIFKPLWTILTVFFTIIVNEDKDKFEDGTAIVDIFVGCRNLIIGCFIGMVILMPTYIAVAVCYYLLNFQ